MLNVEIGPRDTPAGDDDTVYVDCVARPCVSHVVVWGADKLPFVDESVASIYASHVIEHVPWFQTDYALAEAFRVLQPGGRITLFTPDFEMIVAAYLQRTIPDTDPWRRFNEAGDPMKWVNARIFAYFNEVEGPENLHKSAHDFESLSRQLMLAGFVDAVRADRKAGETPHGQIEFGITAVRPLN